MGFGARLEAVENNIKKHYDELKSQRAIIDEMSPIVRMLNENKSKMETHLDSAFADMNSKISGLDKA